MSRRTVLYTSGMLQKTCLLLVVPLFFLVVPGSTSAADCSSIPGTHPAAENEVPGVAAGTCTPDGKAGTLLNGGCDTNPYPYLEQHRGGKVQITPSGTSGDLKDGIHPALACRLSKLIEAFATKGCQIKIISAYRSAQQQQDMCGAGRSGCAAAGRSCHQYGLAVDIASNCTAQLRSYLGTRNPSAPGAQQFKLHFPYSGDHLQCVENAQAACSTATQGCDGSVRINPDLSTIPSTSPTSQLSDAIRKAMGQQPQQPPQSPPPPPPPPQQTTPTTQPTLPTQNTTSSVPSQITPISEILNNNSNTNTNTNTKSTTTKATSSIDLIEEFLDESYVSDSIDIGTAVDINLNPDTNDVTSLDAERPASAGATGTLAVYQGLSVPQTFTSNDLANSPGSGFAGSDNTFTFRILDAMKRALLLALGYLRPFGGYTPAQAYTE